MRVALTAGLIASTVAFPTSTTAAEACPTNNLAATFQEEFYPGLKWDNTNPVREITWTTNVSSIKGNPITRVFSDEERTWLRDAIASWDIALDTVNFKEVTTTSADIEIGLTSIQNSGYWTVSQLNSFRIAGTIQISTATSFTKKRAGFIEVAQSELGNLMGLGDITAKVDYDSVMKDPDTEPYGSIPLADVDIDMMRQFYGESTCHSDWSDALKKAKADAIVQAAADAKAKAEAAAKAEADAKAEAAAREIALQAALDQAKKDELANLKRNAKAIALCSKGKKIVKVVAPKTKCPTGYKRIA